MIEPSQNILELKTLLRAATTSAIKPKVIVEIGTDRGGSMAVWRQAFNPAVLIGIEIDEGKKVTATEVMIFGDSHDEKTLERLKDQLTGNAIDFLFIDGDHTAEGVKKDYEMYSPLVKKGTGIIGLHDVFIEDNDTVGVYKFWNKLKKTSNYCEIHFNGGTGTGVLFL